MRNTWALLCGAIALGLLTGCPPTYPKCNDDEHCKEKGEVCVQGQCQECATDANCKEGFVCDANKCVPKPECANDAQCGAGQKCRAGRCVTGECQSDADCNGGKCRNNRCLAANACTTKTDCPGGQDCVEGICSEAQACRYEAILFDFNESKLSSDAQSQLAALADCIKREKARVTLEGHADERGTEEYNLQLSNRRAASVKKYLADLGVPNAQMDTVGFGENRPAQQGSSEAAYAANRRVEFNKR